jgi:hypothetical protein
LTRWISASSSSIVTQSEVAIEAIGLLYEHDEAALMPPRKHHHLAEAGAA